MLIGLTSENVKLRIARRTVDGHKTGMVVWLQRCSQTAAAENSERCPSPSFALKRLQTSKLHILLTEYLLMKSTLLEVFSIKAYLDPKYVTRKPRTFESWSESSRICTAPLYVYDVRCS